MPETIIEDVFRELDTGTCTPEQDQLPGREIPHQMDSERSYQTDCSVGTNQRGITKKLESSFREVSLTLYN